MNYDLLLPAGMRRSRRRPGARPAFPPASVVAALSRWPRPPGPGPGRGPRNGPGCLRVAGELRRNRHRIPIRPRINRSGLRGGKDHWHDIRSIRPFCIAFAIISAGRDVRFVVDLRVKRPLADGPGGVGLSRSLSPLTMPKPSCSLLWSLGLREPRIIWDTLLAERALHLGGCPLRARARRAESDEEAVRLKQDAAAVAAQSLSLDSDGRSLRNRDPAPRLQGTLFNRHSSPNPLMRH